MTDIATLNMLPEAEFINALGGLFEHSPWVAERTVAGRPFVDSCALLTAMIEVVRSAPESDQLALLNAHPELAATRAAPLTAASAEEQASVGLDALEAAEAEAFAVANRDYRQRFGFPFIIAVKGQRDRKAILAALMARLENDRRTEIATALAEVGKIAGFRLAKLLAPPAVGRLTTHVLDTALGRPAEGLEFTLYFFGSTVYRKVYGGRTNADGRAEDGALLEGRALRPGGYELVFEVGAYWRQQGLVSPPFYDTIPIRFAVAEEDGHYHVPLILSRYGYTTYRGS
jgi:2-oxo-4-hydroxy-4-carboxy-5-ureidoimidazoline decarboxylase